MFYGKKNFRITKAYVSYILTIGTYVFIQMCLEQAFNHAFAQESYLQGTASESEDAGPLEAKQYWAVPGATIIDYDIETDPDNPVVDIRYRPGAKEDLLKAYITDDKFVIDNLLNADIDITLTLDKPVYVDLLQLSKSNSYNGAALAAGSPNPKGLGVRFFLSREPQRLCVNAEIDNKFGVSLWRVKNGINRQSLFDTSENANVCELFSDGPINCSEVEACSQPCEGNACFNYGNCCTSNSDRLSQDELIDSCIPMPADASAFSVPIDSKVDASLIPKECVDGGDPPASQLGAIYPKYRSIIGKTVYCIEESLLRIFLGTGYNSYDNSGSASFNTTYFDLIRLGLARLVTGIITIGVIIYGYQYMFGEKKGMSDLREAQLFLLKLIFVVYFSIGPGMNIVFQYAWPTIKQLSGVLLTSTLTGSLGTTTGSGGSPATTPPNVDQLKNDLDFYAERYYVNIIEARKTVQQHEGLSKEFDRKRAILSEMCGFVNLKPTVVRSDIFGNIEKKVPVYMLELVTAVPLLSGSSVGTVPPTFPLIDPFQKPKDFWSCGVNYSCYLKKFTNDKKDEYLWTPSPANLLDDYVNKDTIPTYKNQATCETDLLFPEVNRNSLTDSTFASAYGGNVGVAYKELVKEIKILGLHYADLSRAFSLINNHNTLVYYYKTLVDTVTGSGGVNVTNSQRDVSDRELIRLQNLLQTANENYSNAFNALSNSCGSTGNTPEALRKANLESQISTLEAERTRNNNLLNDLINQTPRPDNFNSLRRIYRNEINRINNEISDLRRDISAINNSLASGGCIDTSTLQPLINEINRIQGLITVERNKARAIENTSVTVNLKKDTLSMRFERRLAITRVDYPEYYGELYCSLRNIEECDINTANVPPLCLNKDFGVEYIRQNKLQNELTLLGDKYFTPMVAYREACGAGFGLGGTNPILRVLQPPNGVAPVTPALVLEKMHGTSGFLREKAYEAALGITLSGGNIEDPYIALSIIPFEDAAFLATGESSSIEANDNVSYSALTTDTPGNPYISFQDGQIPYDLRKNKKLSATRPQLSLNRQSNLLLQDLVKDPDPRIDTLGRAYAAYQLDTVDISVGDTIGQVDYAMFTYCLVMFGSKTITASESNIIYSQSEISDFAKLLGIHGCSTYLNDDVNFPKASDDIKGTFDYINELRQLCPVMRDDATPTLAYRSWGFEQDVLKESAGLDGTPKAYYACNSGSIGAGGSSGGGAASTAASLDKSFQIMENLLGNDNRKSNPLLCNASVYKSCRAQGLDITGCRNQQGLDSNNKVDQLTFDVLEAKYLYDEATSPIAPNRATLAGGSSSGGTPGRGNGFLSDAYRINVPPSGQTYGHCALLANATDSPFLIWDYLDCKLLGYLGVNLRNTSGLANAIPPDEMPKWLILQFFGFTPIAGLIAVIGIAVIQTIFAITARLSVYYLNALMTVISLVFLAPIFIPFSLMKVTTTLFTNWMNQLIGALMQPVVLSGGFIFVFFIIDIGYFGGNYAFNNSNQIVKAGSSFFDYVDLWTVGAQVDAAIFILVLQIFPLSFYSDFLGFLYVVGLIKLQIMLYAASYTIDTIQDFSGNIAQIYRARTSPVVTSSTDGNTAPSAVSALSSRIKKNRAASIDRVRNFKRTKQGAELRVIDYAYRNTIGRISSKKRGND